MSLILEALRKSEAERRRGQSPDLLTDAIPNVPARQGRSRDMRAIALATVAALVVALLLAAWWRRDTTPPVSAHTSDEEALVVAKASATPPRPLQPPRLQPPASRQGSAPPSAAPREASAQPTAQAHASESPADNATAAPDAERVQASPIAAVPTPTTAAVSAAASFSSPDVPLRLSDLSTEERQQLPALKVSMHMWAPDAAHRFAIIDGTRVNEGDRVGDAAVEAIQQDAVMLAWRGRRIRLPIR